MRKLMIVTAMMLGGCATATATPPAAGADGSCNAGPAQSYVGQPVNEQTGQAILTASGAKTLRWAAPDMMLTMEFNANRVTVHYGTDRRIGSIACG